VNTVVGPPSQVPVGGAFDPNNMTGPAGFGTQGFIQPETMPYRVDFENDPKHATAAAQVVTGTITLDPNLDAGTFHFTSFGFGQFNFTVPAGLYHYQTTIDLRPDGIDLLVPVTLDENPATGVVTVKFQSLDPATMLPPDGLNAGFLPVDDAAGDGEGYFTYTVAPKAGLATGTQISAQASIVFDTNAPLSTPIAVNTIDAGAPTSNVAALPTTSAGSFTLNWSGADDTGGSGIASYSIYYSDNGGPLTPFLTGTTQTSATFTGLPGHTYGFDSVATDNVGNVPSLPATPQTTTTIAATAASHLAVTTEPPVKVSAGAHFNVTVKALNSSGQVDPLFNGPITLTLNQLGRLAGPITVVATAGVATFTGLAIDTAGSYTLQASTLVLAPGTSSSITVKPGKATHLVVTTEPPTSVAANAGFGVIVSAEDAFGNVATTFTGKVGLKLAGGAKLLGTASETAVKGVATFNGLAIDTAASSYSLKATSTTTSGTFTAVATSFALTALAATRLVITTPPPTTVGAGATFGLTIAAEDNFGNVDPNFNGNVSLALTGSGPLTGFTNLAANAGVAVFTGLSIGTAGTGDTLTASATGVNPISRTINVAANGADQLVITIPPTSTETAGGAFTVVVKAENGGAVDSHFTGTISLTLSGPGKLLGHATATATAGVATFTGLAIDTAGSGYTLLAGATAVASAATSSFAVTAGAVTHLVISTPPPSSVAAGTGFALNVSAEDAFGNVNSNFTGMISLALSTNPTLTALDGSASMPASGGVASFTGLSINKAASGYVLTASSGTLTTATAHLNVTAGSATKLVVTTLPPTTVTAGSAFAFAVKAEDQFGNVDTSFNGRVGVSLSGPGNALLHGPTVVAATSGVAVFTGLAIGTAGTGYTLSISSGNLTPATKGITVSAAATPHALTAPPTTTPAASVDATKAKPSTNADEPGEWDILS
jgi:hypothetical protein